LQKGNEKGGPQMNEKAINKMVAELMNLWQVFGPKFTFPNSFYNLSEIEQREVIIRWKNQVKKHPPWRETT
jgi:hypothetical protein